MYNLEDENFPQKKIFVCSYLKPSEGSQDEIRNQTSEKEGEGTHYEKGPTVLPRSAKF